MLINHHHPPPSDLTALHLMKQDATLAVQTQSMETMSILKMLEDRASFYILQTIYTDIPHPLPPLQPSKQPHLIYTLQELRSTCV